MVLAKLQQPILDDGKHWDADKLERKKIADYLTPLVESITQPFVISLASDYGTGKTFFIKCWRKDLEAKGFACVYFNAWQTDFSQDPLFAFIAAMKRELAPLTGADAKFNEAAKKAGGLAAKKLVKIGGKALLRLALGGEAAGDFLEATKISEEDLVKAVDDYAEERLRSQESAERSLDEFKTYLATTVQELVLGKDIAHKKIVVFVDDLDRCRPDYAISVLECIKHLFSVQGLVFVLSIDANQLGQAVKAVYGPSIDSEGYLRKFIDWNFSLPKPSVFQFIDFMFHSSGLYMMFSEESDKSAQFGREFVKIFAEVSSALGFSLRKVEQVFTELNLTLRFVEKSCIPVADRFAFFACLRHVSGEKFSEDPKDQSRLHSFVAENLKNLKFVNLQTHFVRASDVSNLWFSSLVNFEAVSQREREIERRLNSYQEARRAGLPRDETMAKEREKLMAEASEIQVLKDTLRIGGLKKDDPHLTFFGFFYKRLDATAYVLSGIE